MQSLLSKKVMKKFGDPFAQLCTVLYIVLHILQYNSVALDATLKSSNCSFSFSPNSQIFGSHMTVSRQARPGPGIVSPSAKESTLALSQVHPALPQVDLTSIRKQFCTQCIVTDTAFTFSVNAIIASPGFNVNFKSFWCVLPS